MNLLAARQECGFTSSSLSSQEMMKEEQSGKTQFIGVFLGVTFIIKINLCSVCKWEYWLSTSTSSLSIMDA